MIPILVVQNLQRSGMTTILFLMRALGIMALETTNEFAARKKDPVNLSVHKTESVVISRAGVESQD